MREGRTAGVHLAGRTPGSALKDEVEGGSLADRALGPDAPAVAVDDAAGRGQADAGAWELVPAVQALEGAEEPVGIDHVETDPVVLDEDARLAVDHLAADRDLRRAPQAAELPGVVDQVGEQDPNQPLVACRRGAWRDVH